MKRVLLFLLLLPFCGDAYGYGRQDTLRGSNGRGRDWWDVLRYDLDVELFPDKKFIRGVCRMTFKVTKQPNDSMQIDLQDGMELLGTPTLDMNYQTYPKDGNVVWLVKPARSSYKIGQNYTLFLSFRGKPKEAVNPPWDGGFIWTKDSLDKPWIAVACQGLGTSSWWPCKDYQGDEPDSGTKFNINVDSGWPIANGSVIEIGQTGRLAPRSDHEQQVQFGQYSVRNPINTYNTTFYIGDYAHWHDTLHGEGGTLDLDFYPLRYNEAKARRQWTQAKEMLRCFEYWMGPYPFYEDGYKLVEAPYLGMEHQSAIAYGNGYRNGYRKPDGTMIDRSGTGVGMAFDFIIIHESGHEWFGNSVTAQDIADNWLHEGFTTYTETLFAEWIKGKDSAFAYAQGEWKNIKNDRPAIGDYGVNNEGSSDMYDKGAAVVHMIRMMINDDKRFRELLRGLNRDFYHRIVTSKEVEEYISRFVGRDLKPFFDIYLRSTSIPTLTWKASFKDHRIYFSWDKPDISLQVPVCISFDAGNTFRVIENVHELPFGIALRAQDLRVKAAGLYNLKAE